MIKIITATAFSSAIELNDAGIITKTSKSFSNFKYETYELQHRLLGRPRRSVSHPHNWN